MSFGNRLFTSLRGPRHRMVEAQGSELRTGSFSQCPFCQGESILIRKKTSEREVSYQAKCAACGAFGPPGNSPSEAKEFWNERITGAESTAAS